MTDLVFLHLLAGNGGHGKVSFRREKFVAKGGPDGGDGGNGGNIIIRGSVAVNTLREFSGKNSYQSRMGGIGGKRQKTGPQGEDLILEVPIGTVIWQVTENMAAHRRRMLVGGITRTLKRDRIQKDKYFLEREGEFPPKRELDGLLEPERLELVKGNQKFDPEGHELVKLMEFTQDGEEYVVVQGGIGGHGNMYFKSSALTTPLLAEYGSFGEQRLVALELKLLADIGLVGLPNAGKSTLISRLTKARPKVAAYPFTTIEPHLGLYHNPQTNKELVIADIPGLIEGASEGKGLGFQFLRHILNCKVLLYVLSLDENVVTDASSTDKKKVELVWQQYQVLYKELKDFNPALPEKEFQVILNKTDIYSDDLVSLIIKKFKKEKITLIPISAVTGQGVDLLNVSLAKYC